MSDEKPQARTVTHTLDPLLWFWLSVVVTMLFVGLREPLADYVEIECRRSLTPVECAAILGDD